MQLYRGMDIGTAKLTAGRAPRHRRTTCSTSGRSRSRPASPSTSGSPAPRSTTSWPAAGCRCWSAAPASTSGRCWSTSTSPVPTRRCARGSRPSSPTSAPAPLHARLAAADPAAAAKILPTNGRRIVRALEVIELTGAAVRGRVARSDAGLSDACRSASTSTPATLDERIAARVRHMWDAGSSTRSGRCCPTVWRRAYGQPGARLPAGAGVPRRSRRPGPGGRRHDPGDPAVRPPPAHLVPPRPADQAGWTRPRRTWSTTRLR